MPMVWTEPEVFLTHQGITVYHTYKDCGEHRLTYHFTTDITEQEDACEFDVRDLPVPTNIPEEINEVDYHTAIIRHAVEQRRLTLPEDGQKYPPRAVATDVFAALKITIHHEGEWHPDHLCEDLEKALTALYSEHQLRVSSAGVEVVKAEVKSVSVGESRPTRGE